MQNLAFFYNVSIQRYFYHLINACMGHQRALELFNFIYIFFNILFLNINIYQRFIGHLYDHFKKEKSYKYVEKGLPKLGFEPGPPKPIISNSTYVVKVCSFWSEFKLAEI